MLASLLNISASRILRIMLIFIALFIVLLLVVLWQTGVFNSPPPPAALESAVQSLQAEEQGGSSAQQSDQPASTDQPPAEQEAQPESVQQQTEQPEQPADSPASAAPQETQPQPQSEDVQDTPAQPDQNQPVQQQSAQTQTAETAPTLASLTGTWTLSERGASFVGYRIGEELANIGTTTAVGRTSDIEATLTFDGSAITAVVIRADLRTLRSDEGFRDSALRTRGIESDTYPFATFTLTAPIAIDALPSGEAPLSVTVAGTLELHGVTNPVSIQLDGQYVDGLVVVAGSTEIALADYAIEKPTGFRVLSIEDIGIMEFELVFERSP